MELETLAGNYLECLKEKNIEYDRFVIWLFKRSKGMKTTFENYIRFKKLKMKLLLADGLFKNLEIF